MADKVTTTDTKTAATISAPLMHRLAARFVVCLVILVGLSVFASQACLAAVDQNSDGQLNVVDVQELVNLQLGNTTISRPFQGDVNLDGVSDIVDIQLVTNEILGVTGTFTFSMRPRLPGGVVGQTYQQAMQAFGGEQPYAWTYAGLLPPGLVFSANGILSGTPTTVGSHAITFEAVDRIGTRISINMTMGVWPTWQIPVAIDDQFTTPLGTPLLMMAPGVLANDTCPLNSNMEVLLQSGPQSGTLTLGLDGGFSYTPAIGQTTPGVFSYFLFNDVGGTSLATATILVGNLPPVAKEDRYVTQVGTTLIVSAPGVLANDIDPDLDAMTATLKTQAVNGVASINIFGGLTYTPNPTFIGVDTFTYRNTDARGGWADGVVKVRVMAAAIPHEMSMVLTVGPNPARSGETLTISADVTNSWSLLPEFDFVQRVQLDPPSLGITTPMLLTWDSVVNATTSRWKLVLSSPTLPYGLQSISGRAIAYSGLQATDSERFVAYIAPAVHVGVGQTFTTILAGIQAMQPLGAVLIHPGTYTGVGNTMLPGFDGVMAGVDGRDVTTINCVGTNSAFAFDGSMSAMAWTNNAILMGLSIINASNSAVHCKAGVTFFRMSLRDNWAPDHGAAIFLWHFESFNALIRIVECECLRNVLGSLAVGQEETSGAVYHGHSLGPVDFQLFDSQFVQNQAFSTHAASYGVGQFATFIDGCLFEDNVAIGSHACECGALTATNFVGNSIFRRNIARSQPNVAAGKLGSSARAGAIILDGQVSVFNCLFEDNTCQAVTSATGGAIHMQGCGTSVVMDQCKLIGNSAIAGANCLGGAIGGSYTSPRLRADHCQFLNNTASSTTTSINAGGGAAIGFHFSLEGSGLQFGASNYYGAHHCLFSGNKIIGGLSGNCILVRYEGSISGGPTTVGFTVEVVGCTMAGNLNGSFAIVTYIPNLIVKNTIIFNSQTPISWSGHPVTFGTSLSILNSNLHPVMPAAFVGINGNISANPLFVSVPGLGDHFLSQSPGQSINSLCVDTGSDLFTAWPMLFGTTTSTTNSGDFGFVDMGYHYFPTGTPIVPRSPLPPSHFLTFFPCAIASFNSASSNAPVGIGVIADEKPEPDAPLKAPPTGPCG